jgi:hypothetical protein
MTVKREPEYGVTYRPDSEHVHPFTDRTSAEAHTSSTGSILMVRDWRKADGFERIPADLRAEMVDAAKEAINAVWADVGATDAATLASNIVRFQEFMWMQLAARWPDNTGTTGHEPRDGQEAAST